MTFFPMVNILRNTPRYIPRFWRNGWVQTS